MSYGFSMGFAQAKDLSEAMNLALEYVGMRMEPKRVTEELKRNIYYSNKPIENCMSRTTMRGPAYHCVIIPYC